MLRLASVVRNKDPDLLVSWDTQGAGLGYIIERGSHDDINLDMAKLLGRIPFSPGKAGDMGENNSSLFSESSEKKLEPGKERAQKEAAWTGSGLGVDWDEKVGAGQAAASIVSQYQSLFLSFIVKRLI